MKTKDPPPPLLDLARKHEDEPDIQVGGRGMSPADAMRSYMKSPGHVLATLRFFAQQEVEETATATGIAVTALRRYERGDAAPTLPELMKLAAHFGADKRMLLDVFGHVKHDAAPTSMGIAAQFDGDLSAAEKTDLRALLKVFGKKKR